jgi:hypothetical protein
MTPLQSIKELIDQMQASIIGQQNVIERMVLTLLAEGNLLLEGLPGLAKTRAITSMAKSMDAGLSRIQFTPDLLPSDITGTEILHMDGGKQVFQFQEGPIFNNLILADEINRAPAKYKLHCSKPCRKDKLLRRGKLGNCLIYSWSWQPKTRLNRRAPIRFQKHKWTVFSCMSW